MARLEAEHEEELERLRETQEEEMARLVAENRSQVKNWLYITFNRLLLFTTGVSNWIAMHVVENCLQVNRLNAELRGLEEQLELREHEQEASIALRLQEVKPSRSSKILDHDSDTYLRNINAECLLPLRIYCVGNFFSFRQQS